MPSESNRRGFTIVEALASVILITLGIVGCLQTLGALARADSHEADLETMQRLAYRKYDEIIAAGGVSVAAPSGDFQDLGEPRFVWKARQDPTGNGNLDRITVEIDYAGSSNPRNEIVIGLFCRPNTSGGTK